MKILLAGATGYLGSNIAKALSDYGHQVTCIVRPQANTEWLSKINGIKFLVSDIDAVDVELRHAKYDWVINSVCVYRPDSTLYNDMLSANMIYPVQILNLAAKHNVKNFMTAGTTLPDEFNMYSFTKAKLSELGKYLSLHEGLINFIELKLEMFYGNYPDARPEPEARFIKSSVIKLLRNEPLNLTEGNQKRDIIHVEDAANIILALLTSGIKGFRSLPAGSGENHSIREIMGFLHDYTGSNSKLDFGAVPERKGEPNTLANISWYDEIDYKLKYSFFGGLEQECEHVKKSLR